MSEYTFETAALKAVTIDAVKYNKEGLQNSMPMAWGVWTTDPIASGSYSFAIGSAANAAGDHSFLIGGSGYTQTCAVGFGHSTNASSYSIAVGESAKANKKATITIGAQFTDTDGSYTCTTEGTGSITIGAGANTLNPTDADGNPVLDDKGNQIESSNSITIGCKAENKGADSVVIGAQASGTSAGAIVIGTNSRNKGNGIAIGNGTYAYGGTNVVLGHDAIASLYSIAIGANAKAEADGAISIGEGTESKDHSICIGNASKTNAKQSIAIGVRAKVSDYGATVIRSTAEDGTYTQLYFSGANTPLANTYENGEAMMGYVVRDSAGNVMTDAEGNAMVGTQKLSVLFPNNRGENAFTPTPTGLDDDWTPKPMFRPSDLDMPAEEPSEPEEYIPLPVYPIVEPEIEEINE